MNDEVLADAAAANPFVYPDFTQESAADILLIDWDNWRIGRAAADLAYMMAAVIGPLAIPIWQQTLGLPLAIWRSHLPRSGAIRWD